jgi:Tol biopolymer transport system component
MPLTTGTRLGPHEITGILGAGGVGEVYRARDSRLERDVAIKVLSRDLAARPEVYQRFERDARAVTELNHPNICSLFDVASLDGIPFLVMECVEGETLPERLARGPIPLAEAWPILLQIGRKARGTRASLRPSRKSQAFASQFARHDWRYSPDGRFLAYVSDQTGPNELYVTTPSFSEVHKISNAGARVPFWRRGTNELYFAGLDDRLWMAEINRGAKIEAVPKPLFPVRTAGNAQQISVTTDGKRFLMNEPFQSGEGR